MEYIQKLSLMLALLCAHSPSLSAGTLHKLVKNNKIDEVMDFLNKNKDKKKEIINAKNSDGKTPLYQASSKNRVEITKLLLENGAT